MKTIKIFSLLSICLLMAGLSFAQTKTETFAVSGNCTMCKSTIEKAAKKAGASSATWDVDKKELTVTYTSSSTNTAKIQREVANAGYDNAGFKANDAAYHKLHACCQYNRSGEASAAGDQKMECSKDGKQMDCCKDGKQMDCCKDGKQMDCCKDGKCTKAGHEGASCCKKS